MNRLIPFLVLCLALCTSTVYGAVSAAERAALVNFYNVLGGSSWSTNTNWLVNDPCDNSWFGLTCNGGSSAVTAISLAGQGLSGPLPDLSDIVDLETLDLAVNSISGGFLSIVNNTNLITISIHTNLLNEPIPKSIKKLSNVVTLMAYVNAMPGAIPDELGQLSNLQALGLSFNRFTHLPDIFDGTPDLNTAFLGANLFTGPLPATFGDTKMSLFGFEYNSFTGPIPANWANMASTIAFFEVSGNQLTGPLPSFFSTYTSLSFLHIAGNKFTGNPFSLICGMTGITSIKMANNEFTGTMPECVGDLTALITFDIGSNGFSGELPLSIGNATSVSKFDISYNQFTCVDGLPESMAQWSKLQVFLASSNPLGFALDAIPGVENSGGLEPLKLLPLLSIIDVSKCQITGDMSHLANNFVGTWTSIWTGVVEMNFHDNDLSGTIGGGILAYAPVLTKLDVSKNPQLVGSASDLINVKTLVAYGCPNLKWTNSALPFYLVVDENKPFLSYSPMQCPQFTGAVSSSRVFLVDPSYHDEMLCQCDSGYFGQAPNCTSIPYTSSIQSNVADSARAAISDTDYGSARRFVGIDTYWVINEPNTRTITCNITIGPDFVDFTDVLEIFEGDDSLLGKRALLIRGTDTLSDFSDVLHPTADPDVYLFHIFSDVSTIAFRSRDENGNHFKLSYTKSNKCATDYTYVPETDRCEVNYVMDDNMTTAMFIIMGASCVFVIATFILIIIKRHTPVIRSASADFCALILFWTAMMTISSLFFNLEPINEDDSICHFRAWFFGLSLIGMLAPLIVKVLRIKKIFTSQNFNDIRDNISRKALLKTIAIATGIEIAYLIVFSILGMGDAELFIVEFDGQSTEIGNGYAVYGCKSSLLVDVWIYLQGAYFGVIILWAAYSAFATRHVSEQYNESNHIAICVYMILILSIILLPLQSAVSADPQTTGILRVTGICLCAVSFTLALFGPKFLYLFSEADRREMDSAVSRYHTKVSPVTTKSTVTMNKSPSNTANAKEYTSSHVESTRNA